MARASDSPCEETHWSDRFPTTRTSRLHFSTNRCQPAADAVDYFFSRCAIPHESRDSHPKPSVIATVNDRDRTGRRYLVDRRSRMSDLPWNRLRSDRLPIDSNPGLGTLDDPDDIRDESSSALSPDRPSGPPLRTPPFRGKNRNGFQSKPETDGDTATAAARSNSRKDSSSHSRLRRTRWIVD